MKTRKYLVYSILAGILFLGACNEKENNSLYVCSSNIRGDKAIDGVNQWQFRRDSLAGIYLKYGFDIVGLQEAVPQQRIDLCERTGFQFVGEQDLYNPILYRTERLKMLEWDMFWYSESMKPHERGWDAKYERYCTWAKFRDKKTDKEFYVFNTHFDHRGDTARTESAKLLVKQVEKIAGNKPIFIIGDFNSQTDTEAYSIISKHYTDSRKSAPIVLGPEGTGHLFGKVFPIRIDFLFTNEEVNVKKYQTIDVMYEGNRFPSDHYPIYIEASLH